MDKRTKAMIVVVGAFLIAMILLIAWGFADEHGVDAWIICHPTSYVNARMKPSGKSESVGYFSAGDRVVLDGTVKNGFAHSDSLPVEYGEGWIAAGYLVFDEPQWKNGAWYYVCSNGRVAARKCIDGERLCWLKPMTELQVFWWTKEWCVTTRGMIRTEFLEEDPCHES